MSDPIRGWAVWFSRPGIAGLGQVLDYTVVYQRSRAEARKSVIESRPYGTRIFFIIPK
jgi:hypothetical protein